MGKYDFDKIIQRKGTGSIKFDFMEENGKAPDTLPLWIADMDFSAADEIVEAIRKECELGIFGYTDATKDYYPAVSGWFERRFSWKPEKDWMVKTPGIVYAISMAVQAFSNPGESIIIQPPVYYPFFECIRKNGRNIVESPLVFKDNLYQMNLEDFEEKIVNNDVKMFIMCSPHNPVGRVWTEEEQLAVAEICRKHNVIMVVDEIHCDFSTPNHPHRMFLEVCSHYKDMAISCTAPSKSFNLAGLQASNIWIPNPELREKFNAALGASGFFALNNMGMVACKAAYAHGEDWFDECRDYIYENYEFMKTFVEERIPELKVMDLQGTYLAWVDFSALGMSPEEVNTLICEKAKLWLDEGKIFGQGGEQFQRFVLACPRSTLEEALRRLEKAVHSLPQ